MGDPEDTQSKYILFILIFLETYLNTSRTIVKYSKIIIKIFREKRPMMVLKTGKSNNFFGLNLYFFPILVFWSVN